MTSSNITDSAETRADVTGVDAPVVDSSPPAGVFYKVDSSGASFAELWRDARSPLVLILWVSKLLRVALPGSVNDANVELLDPFEADAASLPPDVQSRLAERLARLADAGFDPGTATYHAIVDLLNTSKTYTVTVGRADRRAVGRAIVRVEGTNAPPKTHDYFDVLSELPDGRFLWSTSAKAYLDVPRDKVVRNAHPRVDAAALWKSHAEALSAAPGMPRAVVDPADLVRRHHAIVRDFHLKRKLFRPLTDAQRQQVQSLRAAYQPTAVDAAGSPEDADVLVELERLQHKQAGWRSGLILLAISLIAFLAVSRGNGGGDGTAAPGRFGMTWQFAAMLVGVLFFHELGHYVAMRLFGYRNLRMFFIPFLGAAVSGHHYNVAGWKKAIVALMGPLPGIVVGTVLGVVGLLTQSKLAMDASVLMLILNGFNLLPILPLDGGRVVHALLFVRHPLLDIGFRVAAVALLVAASSWLNERPLLYLAIAMAVGVPMAYRQARVASALRKAGWRPVSADSQTIPPDVSRTILAKLRAASPKLKGSKQMAQQVLGVFETLNARPPGWLGTIGLGTLHVACLVVAVLAGVVLSVARDGNLRTLMQRALLQQEPPKYALQVDHVAVTGPSDLLTPPPKPATAPAKPSAGIFDRLARSNRTVLVANFDEAANVRAAFDAVRGDLGTTGAALHFGQTLLVSIPAGDDAARLRWFDTLERHTKDVQVQSEYGSGIRLACTAPSDAAAERLESRLREYVMLTADLNLVPVWMPTDQDPRTPAERERHDRARATYFKLQSVGIAGRFNTDGTLRADPEMEDLNKQMEKARRRGDQATMTKLGREIGALWQRRQDEEFDRIAEAATDDDRAVVDLYRAKVLRPREVLVDDEESMLAEDDAPAAPSTQPTPAMVAYEQWQKASVQALKHEIGPMLGQLPMSGDEPVPATRWCATYGGAISRNGRVVELSWLMFDDPIHGLPQIVKWLTDNGGTDLRYEFPASGLLDDLD